MHPIRCPQCGMVNHPDDIGFPRCGQCHEDLVRCSSCRHQDATGCRHPQEQVRYTGDDTVARKCPGFRAHTEEKRSRLTSTIAAPLWVFIVLLLVLFIVFSAMWVLDPAGRFLTGNPLKVAAVTPARVAVGEQFYIEMQVENLLQQDSTPIFVEVNAEFLALAKFDSVHSFPTPRHIALPRDNAPLMLEYDPINPKGSQRFYLSFVARERGMAPMSMRVYSPVNHLRQELFIPIDITRRITERSSTVQ